MPQFAVPISDLSFGGWTGAPLWSKIAEGPPGDNVTIQSSNNTAPDACVVKLSPLIDPGIPTGHILRIRCRKSAAGGHEIIGAMELYQGIPEPFPFPNQISVHNAVQTENYIIMEDILAAFQVAQITDYSDLYLRLRRGGDTGGSPPNRRSFVVDWAQFEVPDPPGPPIGPPWRYKFMERGFMSRGRRF